MSDALTVKDIQRRLMVDRYRRSKVCPNYTPKDWWECDVFELTAAGYFREYEIKMTRADFRADAKKQERKFDWEEVKYKAISNKHAELSARSKNGPAEFWFVCPKDIIPVEEIPEWAGLIYARCWQPQGKFRAQVEIVKKAPRLHNQPCDPKVIEHLNGIFYWRFHTHFTWRGQPLVDANEIRKEIGEEILV